MLGPETRNMRKKIAEEPAETLRVWDLPKDERGAASAQEGWPYLLRLVFQHYFFVAPLDHSRFLNANTIYRTVRQY